MHPLAVLTAIGLVFASPAIVLGAIVGGAMLLATVLWLLAPLVWANEAIESGQWRRAILSTALVFVLACLVFATVDRLSR